METTKNRKKEVYLVGDKDSPENNSWLHMTASKEEALKLLAAQGPEGTMKSVELPKGSDV